MFNKFMAYLIVLIVNFSVSVVVYAADVKLETSDFKFYKVGGSYENVRVDLDDEVVKTYEGIIADAQ